MSFDETKACPPNGHDFGGIRALPPETFASDKEWDKDPLVNSLTCDRCSAPIVWAWAQSDAAAQARGGYR